MKKINYKMKQCTLRKSNAITTTWLPIKFAIKGKFLELKDNNIWSDGWKVISVGNVSLSSDYVQDRSKDYKRTRIASDI